MNHVKTNILSYILNFGAIMITAIAFGSVDRVNNSSPIGLHDYVGEELLVVFVGSSTCPASSLAGLPAAVRRVIGRVEETGSRSGSRVATMGVALDWSVGSGMEFLERFGPFDEVSIGRSWMNSAALRYFWRDTPGPENIPQIIVIRRIVALAEDGLAIGRDELLGRAVGAGEIGQWGDTGVRLAID